MAPDHSGRIILLNGTSSAGKSTIARALQIAMAGPWCYYASDQLADAGFRDRNKDKAEINTMSAERWRFFDGFHHSIAAFAQAGNNLIVEHIIERPQWRDDLARLLAPFDLFAIGVHCPVDELRRRETARGDRQSGEAEYHSRTHQFCTYDLEVDGANPPSQNIRAIIEAWAMRQKPGRFFSPTNPRT